MRTTYDLPELVERLRRLADDLERIDRGRGPTAAELRRAPCLTRWVTVPCGAALAGIVEGHPRIGPGPVTTSPLYHLSNDLTWGRTLSRFYRLGEPMFLN